MEKSYESYPVSIVFLSSLLTLSIYAVGAYLFYLAHPYLAAAYVFFILLQEYRLVSTHCVDCIYYGRFCAFGRGRICSVFFKKGDPKKFASMNLTFADLIPDMLLSFLPLFAGAYVLVTSFSWLTAALMLLLLVLSSAGNAFVRRNFACKFCRQREIGCPAEKLFDKKSG